MSEKNSARHRAVEHATDVEQVARARAAEAVARRITAETVVCVDGVPHYNPEKAADIVSAYVAEAIAAAIKEHLEARHRLGHQIERLKEESLMTRTANEDVDLVVQAAVQAAVERCATMAEQIAHRHRVAMDCKPGDFCEDFGCADWLSFAAVLRAPPDPGPHS